MNLHRIAVALLLILVGAAPLRALDLDAEDLRALRLTLRRLARAQKKKDLAEVKRQAAKAVGLLGDAAGEPERAEPGRKMPKKAEGVLAPKDVPRAFGPYLEMIERSRWWRIGLDPTRVHHKPREAAGVIVGCLAARRAGAKDGKRLLAVASEAGDYLIWTQEQAGSGVVPFPAVRNGPGRVFEVTERFLRRAERAGLLGRAVRNGWIVDDLGDGGLQFDNGLAGVALWDLYEATKDDRYGKAARAATDWAAGRRCVPNWNYNSFSVYLLAKAYRMTGERAYLAAAKEKAALGVYPGQLQHGRRRGRWADPHNACIAYHYIMVRGIGALAGAMPADDPGRKAAIRCLTLALEARNREYTPERLPHVDAALEALLVLERDLPASDNTLPDAGRRSTLELLSRYVTAWFRLGRAPVSPAVWGQYLEYVASEGKGRNAE